MAGNLGTVANTSFSVSDGFYTAPFYTSITCPTAGATILYTLDGRSPGRPHLRLRRDDQQHHL